LPNSLRGKKKYDKQFKCLYCNCFETKLARHLERKHKAESAVSDYLKSTSPGTKERKEAVAAIRKKAHFEHNKQVVAEGEGVFLVERRSSENRYSPKDYFPCPECLGFYHRKSLSMHMKTCGSGCTSTKAVKVFYQMFASPSCSSDRFHSVLAVMIEDEISRVVKADALIMKFGRQLYESYECRKETHVSTKMREVGKVLCAIQQMYPGITMSQVILQRRFDDVVQSTANLCNLLPGKKVLSTPSLALKVGHSMKKLAAIALNEAIRLGDEDNRRHAKSYLQLHTTEWGLRISKYSLYALTEKKKAKPLPLTADLQVTNLIAV
jgi:hypothetical protein